MIKFVIPLKPVPAVRMTQKSMYANKYAKRYLQYKRQVAWIAKASMKTQPIDGDVGVKLTHYAHGNRADIDNLFKAVTDSLNKVVYNDDRQVKHMESSIIKCGKEEERTEVEVYRLEGVKQ
ncbi:hypothetical protein GCM10008931_39040 [Oceanobacillus oncorhynchi subsp. oncorhynchi]|uniref:RusA family crossover junction endodeoxyribonuclease n=1 Tax=Oceanobacillus oncorhynchi TaxID=545501 RepID=UPI0031D8A269